MAPDAPAHAAVTRGLVLVVIVGIVIANLRDRLLAIFYPIISPNLDIEDYDGEGDPIDFVMSNNLIIPVLLGVLGLVVVIIALMWVSWRFHTFRVTGTPSRCAPASSSARTGAHRWIGSRPST